MKKLKKIGILICSLFLSLTLASSVEAASYEVEFKAGAYGSINDKKSKSYSIEAGSMFPDEPTVVAKEGYVFTGWNSELPPVGSIVEDKMVFVAKYETLVNGISYIVRYVDENNVAIATPKSTMGEDGSTIVERAKNVAGYTYKNSTEKITLSKKSKEIVFVYTLTNPKEVIRYEEEIINVPAEGGAGTTQPGENANGNITNNGGQNAGEGEEVIPDNPTPAAGETIDDNKTPLAGEKLEDNNTMLLALGIGGAIILLAGGFFILYKRKKKDITS